MSWLREPEYFKIKLNAQQHITCCEFFSLLEQLESIKESMDDQGLAALKTFFLCKKVRITFYIFCLECPIRDLLSFTGYGEERGMQ